VAQAVSVFKFLPQNARIVGVNLFTASPNTNGKPWKLSFHLKCMMRRKIAPALSASSTLRFRRSSVGPASIACQFFVSNALGPVPYAEPSKQQHVTQTSSSFNDVCTFWTLAKIINNSHGCYN